MVWEFWQAADFRCGSISTKLRCPHDVRFPPLATRQRTSRKVGFVPKGDIESAGRPRQKAARRRLFNSNPMIVDQAAINACLLVLDDSMKLISSSSAQTVISARC
jgi:hypothetical protein